METSATGLHAYNQTVTAFPNTNYQASVYARPNGRNYIALNVVDGAGGALVFFDVQAGTIGAQSGVTSANIQQCPNGFFLCTVTFTSSATCSSLNYRVALSTDGITTSYAGDTTKGAYVWGNLMVQQTNVSPNQFIVPYEIGRAHV